MNDVNANAEPNNQSNDDTEEAKASDRPSDVKTPAFPSTGRLLGIDFGTVRIGVAISNADQTLSSPLENYNRRSKRVDDLYFAELSRQERIVGHVVGLPIHMSGDESQKSKEVRKFGAHLQELTGLPVTYFDERYSTAHAKQLMRDTGLSHKKQKGRLDKLAAQVLLSGYLESSRNNEPPQSLDD